MESTGMLIRMVPELNSFVSDSDALVTSTPNKPDIPDVVSVLSQAWAIRKGVSLTGRGMFMESSSVLKFSSGTNLM